MAARGSAGEDVCLTGILSVNGVANTAFVGNDEYDPKADGRRDVSLRHVPDVEDGRSDKAAQDVSGNETDSEKIPVEAETMFLYKISQNPPISLIVFFGFQQALLSIGGSLIIPILVAKAVCASDDEALKQKLISTTLLMNGVTTLMQTVVGIRLPLFQGPSSSYIVPLLALNAIDKTRCSVTSLHSPGLNVSGHNVSTADLEAQLVDIRVRELIGPMMLVGLVHCLVGVTGLVGLLMKFVGPVTIVPTILLIGIYIVKPALDLTEVHFGVAFFTFVIGIVLSLYIGRWPMPIPFFSRQKGFHILWYPLHRVFALLLSILAGWALCGILTASGALTNDKDSLQYKARTDAKADILVQSPWFYVPHPGQFGSPLFSASALVGFMIATLTSILDSIGDYYAAAAMCRVPPPPRHGVNRGIAVEGLCTILSGAMGCGHATTTYGGNIGAIGMTRVASRNVFVAMAIIYILFGVLSKVSAVFITIPEPVLGGSIVTIIGVFVGVNLSNLQVIDLASSRNLSIIGTGIFVGLMVPAWMEKNGDSIDTGNDTVDQVITMLLGNPNFIGCVLACFLDNTVSGTDEERGITAWRNPELLTAESSGAPLEEGAEVYDPLLPKALLRCRLMKYVPIFPYTGPDRRDVTARKEHEV